MSGGANHAAPAPFCLYAVDSGLLRETPAGAIDADSLDLRLFPYGSVVVPTADRHGNAVVVVTQPAAATRADVLVIEVPTTLTVNADAGGTIVESRSRQQGRMRVRIRMQQLMGATGDLPTAVAVVRFIAGLAAGEALSPEVRHALATVCYTIRVGDRPGWFEHGDDGWPDASFRHGFPDIATREQGSGGIRSPSLPVVGLQPPISAASFAPVRARPLERGERVIYELHVGTFTMEGTFVAAADRLEYLHDKGFTTVQLMPVDVSSGPPGWTYDQTRTGAVDAQCYGGASGLIHFVARAHALGLDVIVDKQYNHGGPEQDSRPEIIPGLFGRDTIWGPGISGEEALHYPQIVKLIGEEIAYWASQFGLDGFRIDATNRLPWELHGRIAEFGRWTADLLRKPLYLLSEYAECEFPKGRRVPTGHQYTDQTGRYVMKMLGLSRARHLTELPHDDGSLLRPMLKSARRGWWYPDVEECKDGLRVSERATTLLWHHDWIGNRFGGERIHHLISFPLFKTLAVWQALGQWTPLIFMGTERHADTPWFYFTGHRDKDAQNHTSAFYQLDDGTPVLRGGRFHEFAAEAGDAGLREAMGFSSDGTISGIDWDAFRQQVDRAGRPYMDHARRETFHASKIDWSEGGARHAATERLFEKVLNARGDARLKEEEPHHTQYKAWSGSERVFVMRRRGRDGDELVALFNLGTQAVTVRLGGEGIELDECGTGYIVGLYDGESEHEWGASGRYSLWLDTNWTLYGGGGSILDEQFDVKADGVRTLVLVGATAVVYSRTSAPGR